MMQTCIQHWGVCSHYMFGLEKQPKYLKWTLVLQQCVVTYYVCGLDYALQCTLIILTLFPIFATRGASLSLTFRDHYKLNITVLLLEENRECCQTGLQTSQAAHRPLQATILYTAFTCHPPLPKGGGGALITNMQVYIHRRNIQQLNTSQEIIFIFLFPENI